MSRRRSLWATYRSLCLAFHERDEPVPHPGRDGSWFQMRYGHLVAIGIDPYYSQFKRFQKPAPSLLTNPSLDGTLRTSR